MSSIALVVLERPLDCNEADLKSWKNTLEFLMQESHIRVQLTRIHITGGIKHNQKGLGTDLGHDAGGTTTGGSAS